MDCHEWKRTNGILLYGSITRKMIAGMMVRYAMAPAALSDRPELAATGWATYVGGGVPPAPAGAACAAAAAIGAPQWLQKAF